MGDEGTRLRTARLLFGAAALFNLAIGLPLLVAWQAMTRSLGLDAAAGTNAVAANLVAAFVLLFGLMYALVAWRPAANRNLVAPMVVGKLVAVAGTVAPWLGVGPWGRTGG